MQVDDALIEKLAELSMLTFNAEEKKEIKSDDTIWIHICVTFSKFVVTYFMQAHIERAPSVWMNPLYNPAFACH